jgi:16S rRNA (guanine527-N7)-methyltransferase
MSRDPDHQPRTRHPYHACVTIAALPPTPEFLDAARLIGLEFEPGDLARLEHFLALLLEQNRSMNLTAITDPAQAWTKHILDAMTLLPVIATFLEAAGDGADQRLELIDVGSGGGVPAIPLAIVLPTLRVTMLEATGKKADYLRRTVAALSLTNAAVLHARAEAVGQDRGERTTAGSTTGRAGGHRERYDLATARALGHLAVVCELCGPLLRPGGLLLAVKGGKAEQELEESRPALGELGLRHAQTIATPTGRVVVLEKTSRTPKKYPRRDGEPARLPIGL